MLGLTDLHIAHREVANMGKGWAGHEKFDGQYILVQRKPTYLLLGNISVTPNPLDPKLHSSEKAKKDGVFYFGYMYSNPAIYSREGDMYSSDVIFERYKPSSMSRITTRVNTTLLGSRNGSRDCTDQIKRRKSR